MFIPTLQAHAQTHPAGVPGGLLIRVKSGQPLAWETFGNSDPRRPSALGPATHIPLGRLSDLLITLLLLDALEKGSFELTDNLNSHLEQLQIINPFESPLTLRELLLQRDGFPEMLSGRWSESRRSVPALSKRLQYQLKPLVQPPGAASTPDSWGRLLAIYLLETRIKQPLTQQIQQKLDLKSARTEPVNSSLTGHLPGKTGPRRWPSDLYSTAPLYDQLQLSAGDLQRLLQHLTDARRSDTLRHYLFTPQWTGPPGFPGRSYGLLRHPGTEAIFFLESHQQGLSQALIINAHRQEGAYLVFNLQNRDQLWNWARQQLKWLPPETKPLATHPPQQLSGIYGYRHYHRQSLAALARLHRGLLEVRESPNGALHIRRQGSDPFGGFAPESDWKPIGKMTFQRTHSTERIVFSRDARGLIRLHSAQDGQAEFEQIPFQERPLTQAGIAGLFAVIFGWGLLRSGWRFWQAVPPLEEQDPDTPSDPALLMSAASACGLTFVLGFPVAFFQEPIPGELALSWQEPLNPWIFGLLAVPLFQLALSLIALLLAAGYFRHWNHLDRWNALLQLIATPVFLLWLQSWRLIGFQL